MTARTTRLDVSALYDTLDKAREEREISWRELARQTGVSPSTLTRMSNGKRPDVNGLAALVRWLGMPAEKFIRTVETAPKRRTPSRPATMAAITAVLRADRNLSDHDADYIQQALEAAYKFVRAAKKG
jgi:transcriptional regulator with XRE-family HTH domain